VTGDWWTSLKSAIAYDRAVNPRRYRQLITVAAGLLIVLIGIVWILNPQGESADLPRPVEGLFPLPGDAVVRQTAIEVDLPVGYSLDLEVDGVSIPTAEIGFTPATGQYTWQPGPTTLFEVWDAGEHEVTIRWERLTGGGPDPGEFTWRFRIT